MLTAINVSDVSPASDDFTALATRHPLCWVRLSGLPAGRVEPRIAALRVQRHWADYLDAFIDQSVLC
ncbi:hypothetical protein [Comamonas faecalis]